MKCTFSGDNEQPRKKMCFMFGFFSCVCVRICVRCCCFFGFVFIASVSVFMNNIFALICSFDRSFFAFFCVVFFFIWHFHSIFSCAGAIHNFNLCYKHEYNMYSRKLFIIQLGENRALNVHTKIKSRKRTFLFGMFHLSKTNSHFGESTQNESTQNESIGNCLKAQTRNVPFFRRKPDKFVTNDIIA